MTTPIELLAPARDLECGRAAIDCGADAVYIGAPRFGARSAAGNSLDDIARLAEHAHKYWARVYVTLNTLLHEAELEPARRMAWQVHEAGADGLIVQDVGLLEGQLPPVSVIASTQMHNHTPERVAFLEQVGFARAILARELDLEGIAAIRRATTLALEVFVHGALCVCMSGRCALSYALGGRSGNRGQCAQPCRRGYALVDGSGQTVLTERHLLSLRDLNLTAELDALVAAGITSFKIEGRLKNKAYVMNVVGHYRRALDQVLTRAGGRRSSSGTVALDFLPNPDKTFNRGYTTYFLHGRGAEVASPGSPKHVGEPVGSVTSVSADSFTLDRAGALQGGDGITFYHRDAELAGARVNRVQGATVFPQTITGIAPGARVFRNHDHAFAAELARSRPRRTLGVDLVLRESERGVRLEAVDEDGIHAAADLACAKVSADRPAPTVADVRERLARLGNTEFAAQHVALDWSVPLHLAAKQWNGLRRALVENLVAARAQARPRAHAKVVPNDAAFPEATLDFRANVLNQKARAFYQRHQVQVIEPAAESGLTMDGRTVMTCRYCLKYELGLCPRQASGKPRRVPPEPWFLVDDEGRRLRLHFRCERTDCVMELEYP
jgi:putative protease